MAGPKTGWSNTTLCCGSGWDQDPDEAESRSRQTARTISGGGAVPLARPALRSVVDAPLRPRTRAVLLAEQRVIPQFPPRADLGDQWGPPTLGSADLKVPLCRVQALAPTVTRCHLTDEMRGVKPLGERYPRLCGDDSSAWLASRLEGAPAAR